MVAAAEPVLASVLWSVFNVTNGEERNAGTDGWKRRRVITGCRSVDEPLKDGLVYGEGGICYINSDPADGGKEVGTPSPFFTTGSSDIALSSANPTVDSRGSLDQPCPL